MMPIMENIAPAKRALAALDNPPTPTDALPAARRISKRITAAIDLMVSGECKNISDAAQKAGLARESLSRGQGRLPAVNANLLLRLTAAAQDGANEQSADSFHEKLSVLSALKTN
jgi:hypothetical protein